MKEINSDEVDMAELTRKEKYSSDIAELGNMTRSEVKEISVANLNTAKAAPPCTVAPGPGGAESRVYIHRLVLVRIVHVAEVYTRRGAIAGVVLDVGSLAANLLCVGPPQVPLL